MLCAAFSLSWASLMNLLMSALNVLALLVGGRSPKSNVRFWKDLFLLIFCTMSSYLGLRSCMIAFSFCMAICCSSCSCSFFDFSSCAMRSLSVSVCGCA